MSNMNLKFLSTKIRRKICSKLCFTINNKTKRVSLYPYLSGDFFRSIADILIENDSDLDFFKINFKSISNKKNIILFISASFLENKLSDIKSLLANLTLQEMLKNTKLIIHNGDIKPYKKLLSFFSQIFHQVFFINLTDEVAEDFQNVFQLPLGIENYYLNRNGSSSFFLEYYRNDFYNLNIKNIKIFSCFDISTNIKEREYLGKLISSSRHEFSKNFINPEDYLINLSKSFFTISPPGNGDDCHRIWEAIYLNSVPVIKEGSLSSFITKQLPILEVSRWEDILYKTEDELMFLYNNIMKKNKALAYADFWINKIKK
jgi:hypothetical protein